MASNSGYAEDSSIAKKQAEEPLAAVAGNAFLLTGHLLSATRPDSIQAESFRALRSNLLSQHIGRGRRALSICSPNAEAGCSFVAANLAFVMSQAGINTLLIDGNLREPALQEFIRPSSTGPGLAECLADDTLPLSSAIQRVQASLSVLYAGRPDATSVDRLGSSIFRGLLSQCLRDFDLTIIDTPPSSLSADARRIAAVTHYAMIVTRRDQTFVKDVRVILDELVADGAAPIGTYLNDF